MPDSITTLESTQPTRTGYPNPEGLILQRTRDLTKRHRIERGSLARCIVVSPDDLRALHFVYDNPRFAYLERESMAPIHPAVLAAMRLDYYGEEWLSTLVAEYPHLSDDGERIAYTRDWKAGLNDRQTVTSVGKYLTRMFPTLRSDEIRDIVIRHHPSAYVCQWAPDTVEAFVHVAQNGPNSCMRWTKNAVNCMGYHPYECYSPELGWRMAVRVLASEAANPTKYYGRALVNEGIFVRSFGVPKGDEPSDSGYSNSDHELEAWLQSEGIEHKSGWAEGTRLTKIERRNGDVLCPYIDGDQRRIDVGSDYLEIDSYGKYEADTTDGSLSGGCTCSRCGTSTHEDDLYSTYDGCGDEVCEHCLDNHYVSARCHGGEIYVLEQDAIRTMDGDYYVYDDIGHFNIGEIEYGDYSGEYTTLDDMVFDCRGDSWHIRDVDNGFLVRITDASSQYGGEYVDANDAVQDTDGEWWHEDVVGDELYEIDRGTRVGEYGTDDNTVSDKTGGVWHVDDMDTLVFMNDDGDWVEMAAQRTLDGFEDGGPAPVSPDPEQLPSYIGQPEIALTPTGDTYYTTLIREEVTGSFSEVGATTEYRALITPTTPNPVKESA